MQMVTELRKISQLINRFLSHTHTHSRGEGEHVQQLPTTRVMTPIHSEDLHLERGYISSNWGQTAVCIGSRLQWSLRRTKLGSTGNVSVDSACSYQYSYPLALVHCHFTQSRQLITPHCGFTALPANRLHLFEAVKCNAVSVSDSFMGYYNVWQLPFNWNGV